MPWIRSLAPGLPPVGLGEGGNDAAALLPDVPAPPFAPPAAPDTSSPGAPSALTHVPAAPPAPGLAPPQAGAAPAPPPSPPTADYFVALRGLGSPFLDETAIQTLSATVTRELRRRAPGAAAALARAVLEP